MGTPYSEGDNKTNDSLGAEHLDGERDLRNTLTGIKTVMLSFFSFYRYSCYRAYEFGGQTMKDWDAFIGKMMRLIGLMIYSPL